jgi:hypothetical protein
MRAFKRLVAVALLVALRRNIGLFLGVNGVVVLGGLSGLGLFGIAGACAGGGNEKTIQWLSVSNISIFVCFV